MEIKREIILEFLDLFDNECDYFECHEILEEAWKNEFDDFPRDNGYVVLLQVAVCLHHQRNGNYNGAIKMVEYIEKNYKIKAKEQLSEYFNLKFLETFISNLKYSLLQEEEYQIRKLGEGFL